MPGPEHQQSTNFYPEVSKPSLLVVVVDGPVPVVVPAAVLVFVVVVVVPAVPGRHWLEM